MAIDVASTPVSTDWHRRFRGLAWGVLVFTVAVIVSGDLVQATESGAGCGESWPRCDNSLIPSISDAHTAIEFTHRIGTTVLTLGFIALLVGAWRLYDRGHPVRKAAVWANVILVVEILLGAALVLFGWVEDDASWGRVAADSFHVVNTFLLVGSVLFVAWLAGGGRVPRIDPSRRTDQLLLISAVIVMLIAISGTINSLADTLALSDNVDIDETPIAAILVSVRGIHPVLAIGGGMVIFYLMAQLRETVSDDAQRMVLAVQAVIGLQFVVGILNIALLTPLETQIVHLVLADTIWIVLLWLGLHLFADEQKPARAR